MTSHLTAENIHSFLDHLEQKWRNNGMSSSVSMSHGKGKSLSEEFRSFCELSPRHGDRSENMTPTESEEFKIIRGRKQPPIDALLRKHRKDTTNTTKASIVNQHEMNQMMEVIDDLQQQLRRKEDTEINLKMKLKEQRQRLKRISNGVRDSEMLVEKYKTLKAQHLDLERKYKELKMMVENQGFEDRQDPRYWDDTENEMKSLEKSVETQTIEGTSTERTETVSFDSVDTWERLRPPKQRYFQM